MTAFLVRMGHSSIRVTLDTYSHVMSGLQEAAAQRFDDLLAARDVDNVGKMSAKTTKDAGKYPQSGLGVVGFEPTTT